MSFTYQQNGGMSLLVPMQLNGGGTAQAFFSTRSGGVSRGAYNSLNLSWRMPDEKQNVQRNFELLVSSQGWNVSDLVFAQQTHSSDVAVVDRSFKASAVAAECSVPDVDALITADPDVILTVRTADCVPVLIEDRKNRVIAAVHSGWRGTVGDIVGNTLRVMKEKFNTEGKDCFAAVGPCICADCFEVDEPVAQAFLDARGGAHITKRGKKYHIDLVAYVEDGMYAFGIPSENVEVSRICTAEDTVRYFSHRAEHGNTGGMCAFIRLNQANL